MRDPRLVEIDFLMALESSPVFHVISTMDDKTSGVRVGDRVERFGLDARRFRDLTLDLLLNGFVAGYAMHSTSNYITERKLGHERDGMIEQLIAGQQVNLLLSHRGRVRLWTLRDALLRDPDIEPFGLFSRAAFDRHLPVYLRWATSEEPLSISLVDLDKFKAVNDELGHPVGDDVLRTTFTLVKNLVGSRGRVYRYGGEEIGVLLPKTQHAEGTELAEELRIAIEKDVIVAVPRLGALKESQTASIGVATYESSVDPRLALEYVDGALYEAKNSGRNRVVARPVKKG